MLRVKLSLQLRMPSQSAMLDFSADWSGRRRCNGPYLSRLESGDPRILLASKIVNCPRPRASILL